MEDFGGLIWLAILWFFVSFLSGQKKRKQRAEQARRRAQAASQATLPAPPEPTPADVTRTPTSALPSRATASRGRGDPTQREGSALERMLKQLGAELGQLEGDQQGPMGRDAKVELPSAEEVEEREVLDGPVRRVERVPVVRETRVVVDHDKEAGALLQRRLAVATEHNRPRTLADHGAFDAKIRQAPAQVRSKARFNAKQIRQAIVWREILGPPMALRGERPD